MGVEISMFENNLERGSFCLELLNYSYLETQEGYNLLACQINERIDPRLKVELQLGDRIEVILSYIDLDRRFCCVSVRRSNWISEISEIVNLLVSFASGIGFDC